MQFTSREIGLLLAVVASPLILFPFLMAYIARKYSLYNLSVACFVTLGVLVPLIPGILRQDLT